MISIFFCAPVCGFAMLSYARANEAKIIASVVALIHRIAAHIHRPHPRPSRAIKRKHARAAAKKAKQAKSKSEAAEYHKLLALRIREQRERRSESLAKRRASSFGGDRF